ncbi:MAG: DUF5615 family PIN-like protein [Hyphomicrobiaceae bacterium]
MRVLLDANVPRGLKRLITGHDVATARERRLNALPDGAMLDAMHGAFDVLVTVDKSIPHQNRLDQRSFAVVILRARSNHIRDLLPLVPDLLLTLTDVKPGQVREIGS